MDVCKCKSSRRLQGYRGVLFINLSSLTVAVLYLLLTVPVLKIDKFNTTIITADSVAWRAVKILAAADSFGWLGSAPSVFQRRWLRANPAGSGGANRRLRGLVHT